MDVGALMVRTFQASGNLVSLVLPSTGRRVPCEQCPLRPLASFRDFTPSELKFVSSFKTGEMTAEVGPSEPRTERNGAEAAQPPQRSGAE